MKDFECIFLKQLKKNIGYKIMFLETTFEKWGLFYIYYYICYYYCEASKAVKDNRLKTVEISSQLC